MNDALDQLFTQKPDTIFMVAAILALPWILAAIYREQWSPTVKSLATIAACFVVTGGNATVTSDAAAKAKNAKVRIDDIGYHSNPIVGIYRPMYP